MRYCVTTLLAKYYMHQSRAFASLAQASRRAAWTVAQSFVCHKKKRLTFPHQLDRQTKMSDSKHQETVARKDDGDPKENDQPATVNLTRAVEVAEELLQAIKQATPTSTGKQSVLEPPPPFHGVVSLPGVLPKNYTPSGKKKIIKQ